MRFVCDVAIYSIRCRCGYALSVKGIRYVGPVGAKFHFSTADAGIIKPLVAVSIPFCLDFFIKVNFGSI